VIASIVVAVGTAVVIMTGSLLPFLNPVFVGFEQRRAEALAWSGYTDAELTAATNAILSDLVLGTGDFEVTVAGEPVLSDAERAHMRDVRTVFAGLWVLTAVSAAALVIGWWRAARGGPPARAAYWAAVRSGAGGLAVAVIGLGVVAVVAFDLLFEAFHRLLFPPGSYTFDPATQRLVQLFPFRFWQETAIAVGAAIVLVCGAVTLLARRGGRTAAAPTGERWSATEGRRARP
jgi:integral membrane protein (TIGR01906 family)